MHAPNDLSGSPVYGIHWSPMKSLRHNRPMASAQQVEWSQDRHAVVVAKKMC